MNKEQLSQMLSGIDERFIEEAASIKKKNRVYKYASAAAVLAVLIIAGFAFFGGNVNTPPVITDNTTIASQESGNKENKVPELTPEIAPEIGTQPSDEQLTQTGCLALPRWEDLAIPLRYGEATLGDITYSTMNTEISEDNVLGYLGSTKMQGFAFYTDKTYEVTGEIYSIRSIAKECAVAVRIDGGKEYYVYVNSWYEPEDLGEFISDLDLKNNVRFGEAYIDTYEYHDLYSSHKRITYADFDDSVIWDLLETSLSAKNTEYNHPYERIGVSTDLPLLGYKDISFCITPDGYVITNILNTQKCFYIGTEKFTEFDEYLKNNVSFKENTTVYEKNPDGSIPGKEVVSGQSTPGYDPDAPVEIAPPYNPETDSAPPETITKGELPEDFLVAEETTRIN